MARICPVCGNSVSFLTMIPRQRFKLHPGCIKEFHRNPEKYGGKAEKAWGDLDKAPSNSEPSDKDFITTLLICVFLGGLGGHRFFVGKEETAIAMLVIAVVAVPIFEFLAFGFCI